jgi:ADP-heptose:LPS heptosyltransferase
MMGRFSNAAGSSRKTVILCPGAGVPVRLWPIERYREVIGSLVARDVRVVVVGGPQDRSAGARLAAVGNTVLDLTGKSNVREMFALMRHADLYVGNNTGAMHMAAALGVPCVMVTSASDPEGSWTPYGEGHVVLGTRPVCQACMKETCDDARCILSVTPGDVVDACLRKLRIGRSG